MPTTIIQPTTGELFGPGWRVEVQTDRTGPEPTGSTWWFLLRAPAGETLQAVYHFPVLSQHQTLTFFDGSDLATSMMPLNQQTQDGAAASLTAQLVDPSGSVLEQTTTNVTIERQQGAATELAQYLATRIPAAGTGLSTEEHNAVLQTNVGVIALAGIDPIGLADGLLSAIGSSHPLAFGSLGAIQGPLTGDGALSAPPALHIAMGVYWVATTIPPGLGHRHGQSEEYPARLVQWRTTHVVDGIEMATEVLDATTHRELWRFKQQTPHAVEYSVLPGVEVFARYWLFP